MMRETHRLGRVSLPLTFRARVSTTRGADGGQRREVLRRLADAPLLGGKPDKVAVFAIEPGAGAGETRPARLRSTRRER